MIALLINILILVIILYVLYLVLGYIQLPHPIKQIVYLIVGLIVIVYLLQMLGVAVPYRL